MILIYPHGCWLGRFLMNLFGKVYYCSVILQPVKNKVTFPFLRTVYVYELMKENFPHFTLLIYRIHSSSCPCPIIAQPSYFEVTNHKIVTMYPDLFMKHTYFNTIWNSLKTTQIIHIFGRSLQQILKQISIHPKWFI